MKTIQHNGVPCVEAKVHMLPTEDASHIFMLDNVLKYSKTKTKVEKPNSNQCQHLYITTDEKPKKGEWCYAPSLDRVFQITSDAPLPNEARKIIATTDPKLIAEGVKEIPQSFIEDYCKAGGIDEVLVEYQSYGGYCNGVWEHSEYKPKLNPDNTIIIHHVEEKMYSREQVFKFCEDAWQCALNVHIHPEFTLDKWIKENL